MDLNQFSTVDIVLDKANDNIIQRQTISAGDRDGRSLTLQVTNEGSIGEVPGLTANLLWTNHSSGLSDLSAFSVVDRLTSVFKIEYPQNMLTAGKVTAQIQLLHNGKVTHSKKFEIIVLDVAGNLKGVLQTAEYTALVEALAKTNEFETDIAEVTAQLAQKAEQTSLNIEKARIDSFTSLASGSTTGDAELIDGRIGADGKTYTNIGGAIRGQFDGLKNGLTSFAESYDTSVGGRSISDNVTIISGSGLNSSGGLNGDHTYSYTDYHEVNPSTLYNLNWVATPFTRICEYDANKVFVKATSSGNILNTASNTKYIRYCALTTVIDSFKITTPIIMHPNAVNSTLSEVLTGNVFDGVTYSNGYYGNNGVLVNTESFRNTTIPVSQGDIIRWKYETADLENQNGVLFSGGLFKMALKDFQKNVNNKYYEATIPDGVDTVYINFKIPSAFIVVVNTPYHSDAKYGTVSIPKLDVTNSVSQALSDAEVSLRNDVPYSKIFRKVACIGDSLTHGYYGDKDGTVYGTYKDYAYPAFLSKIISANVENLGLSGRTAKSWYEQYSTAFSSDKTDWSKYDAFIIFLGTNGGLDGDINANAGNETQMGYYCRIIEMIKNANSEASIFLCTSPWTQNRDYFSNFTNQVIALGEAYSLPVLRLDQSQILTYENRLINQPYDRVLHFGRVGLMRMASEIARCIDAYGSANPAYFNKLYGVKS